MNLYSRNVFCKLTEELVRRLPLENLKIHKNRQETPINSWMYDYGLLSLNKSLALTLLLFSMKANINKNLDG
jgi:hypothetical protein